MLNFFGKLALSNTIGHINQDKVAKGEKNTFPIHKNQIPSPRQTGDDAPINKDDAPINKDGTPIKKVDAPIIFGSRANE